MQIYYSSYQLKKKSRLNAQDHSQLHSQLQRGALIKLIEGDFFGVADLCPKPELGDLTLEHELQERGTLFQRAWELAQEDLKARREQCSLLQNKFVKNNYLITDYKNTDLNQVKFLSQTVKIKGDANVNELAEILNAVEIDLTLRIDFNSILTPEKFEVFLSKLNQMALQKIEYIEDPTMLNAKWKTWNLSAPLAFDFQKGEYSSELAKYRILKPSRQKLPADLSNCTLTAAMEHPVGLAHGLRLAQRYAVNDSGFLTLDLFEDDGFSKYFILQNNLLNFSETALNDFGIGMTEELKKLEWQAL